MPQTRGRTEIAARRTIQSSKQNRPCDQTPGSPASFPAQRRALVLVSFHHGNHVGASENGSIGNFAGRFSRNEVMPSRQSACLLTQKMLLLSTRWASSGEVECPLPARPRKPGRRQKYTAAVPNVSSERVKLRQQWSLSCEGVKGVE